jgi:DNA-binding PadR family transcriptional regulator
MYPIWTYLRLEREDATSIDGIRGSSDRSVLVLTSLASGAKHGYALIKDIEEFAGVKMGPGTLYGCLAKLETAGLIEPLPAQDRRHPYRITETGALMLTERLNESARIARIGLKRLAGAM